MLRRLIPAFVLPLALSVAAAQQAPRVNGGLPSVSPDGRHLAYWGDRGGGAQLFVSEVDGSHERQITSGPEDHGRAMWATDGRVVYADVANDTGPSTIYSVGLDGAGRREIGRVAGRNPTLLSDGRTLYVSGGWSNAQLSVSARDGSGAQRISDGSAATWNPAVSPDERQVAYTRSGKGDVAVWVMNVAGSAAHAITHFTVVQGRAQVPAWSPDGKRIAFQASARSVRDSTQTVGHIWIINLGDGALIKLAPHEEPYLDETPAWFPDGKRIAFQSNRTGRMEIWLMNADGTGARQVTGR